MAVPNFLPTWHLPSLLVVSLTRCLQSLKASKESYPVHCALALPQPLIGRLRSRAQYGSLMKDFSIWGRSHCQITKGKVGCILTVAVTSRTPTQEGWHLPIMQQPEGRGRRVTAIQSQPGLHSVKQAMAFYETL